jgi:hypothetical protein
VSINELNLKSNEIEIPHRRVKRVDPDVASIQKAEEIAKKIQNAFHFDASRRIINTAQDTLDSIKNVINKYKGNITSKVQNLVDDHNEEMNWLSMTINNEAQKAGLINKLKEIIAKNKTHISQEIIEKTPIEIKDKMVESIKAVFADLMTKEKKDIEFMESKDTIKGSVKGIASEAKEIGETMVDYVSNFFDKMEGQITSKFNSFLFDMTIKNNGTVAIKN